MKNLFLALAFLFVGSVGFANEVSTNKLKFDNYNVEELLESKQNTDLLNLLNRIDINLVKTKVIYSFHNGFLAPCAVTYYLHDENGVWVNTITVYNLSLSCDGFVSENVYYNPQLA